MQKTAYELSRSQIATPLETVRTFWQITHGYRDRFSRVLDLGAGDGRFARYGSFDCCRGVEIDPSRSKDVELPSNASISHGCAFRYDGRGYDACVGNPPYVRHHDLQRSWRDRIAERLGKDMGMELNRKCNLYVYFMILALMKAADDGLVSLLVPYEWVSRPAAAPLRRYVRQNDWNVDIYRFTFPVFDGVLTTASISVIDKNESSGRWNYFEVNRKGAVKKKLRMTGSRYSMLSYEDRGNIWAHRGMSPGTQKVFTLTEGERIHAGLRRKDVLPCVTTLRSVPRDLSLLTNASFKKRFVDAGKKCWLIRSHERKLSARLMAYLDAVPEEARETSTCQDRDIWYKFDITKEPKLLVSTGFTSFGPKVIINSIGAHAIGSVCGIHSDQDIGLHALRDCLLSIDFEKRVVAHAGSLKKIEMRQINSVLNEYLRDEVGHGC